ncbi:TetR/AcrR family transcriptional regulator [Actinomadura sp. GC306]|uniref:TetR/AcrR family transcriptional regulator n=1 Tax=Actinomadura sp. GC306 TaxID=2530367 RepID=UPI00104357AE|nr:TetR/AcrR family transcriptional regulator [Actinomadura sp. GC306]TDC71838.1 TetR/AcrR family transcriptional regulator [Actinomadura sp. GC306]
MTDQRPYATLLAKGEERRQRILTAAQRLLRLHGFRGITLAQIARDAGVSSAGLLHHFESKEALLHAALDVRDERDEARLNRPGGPIQHLNSLTDRFHQTPDLVGMFAVLLMENLDPGAPLHERFLSRYRTAVDTLAEDIRAGQRAGRYRLDLDPAIKATEIVAFLNGIETSWLLDPSIPLDEVFQEYTASLSRQFAPPPGDG